MEFDILDYLGKFEDGVLTLVSLNYDGNYYDSTFFYKENYVTITIEEKLEDIIGEIEKWSGYDDLIVRLMKKVIPYDEIITRLDDVDVSSYINGNE